MRHGNKFRKLNRTSSHRKALFLNMSISLIKHGRIKTTLAKAKELRPFFEKLITKAKSVSLHNTRMLVTVLHDKSVVSHLLHNVAPRYTERNGGYTRILKISDRKGDCAPMALIELV